MEVITSVNVLSVNQSISI